MSDLDDRLAWDILARYPMPLHRGLLVPLGNRGGYSGARLWRLEGPLGSNCLRLWPPEPSLPSRLPWIHEQLRLARGDDLFFVPALILTAQGQSWVLQRGRYWEVTQWMSGQADYHVQPTAARLRAACTGVARLHLSWARTVSPPAICPAVERRLGAFQQWSARLRSGWAPPPPQPELIQRAWRGLVRYLDRVPVWLLPWTMVLWPLQPCVCDIWHDHLLFEGDRLTGLVDFGSLKMDHPSVDLARLLGSLAEDDEGGWREGLSAYREVRPLSAEEEQLARALDRSGTILGAANWMRWLFVEKRTFENPAAAEARLARLVERIERWS
jgi:Ser/Thr protein kinase RdoA (MazF antagonist)